MVKSNKNDGSEGRMPPPTEHQFKKGYSGNPAGRPRGSVNREQITRKIASKKHHVKIDGKTEVMTTLDAIITKVIRIAIKSVPAANLVDWMHDIAQPILNPTIGGVAVGPSPVTPEAFMAREEERNAGKVEPGTEPNIMADEFEKAVRGIPSPLGEAQQAFHIKYGAGG